MERVTPVSRAGVDHRARERAGELDDLADVDVDEALADDLSHQRNASGTRSRLASRVDRLVRVLHQALSAADRPWDVEAMVEVPEVLRGFERFFERGLSEAQCGAESFELTLIDLTRRHFVQMLTSAP